MSDNSDFIQELKVVYNLKSDEELIIKLYMDKSALLSRVKEARVRMQELFDTASPADGTYPAGLGDGIDSCMALFDNFIPEAKEEGK